MSNEKILILKKLGTSSDETTCEFTEMCDKYTVNQFNLNRFRTYLYDAKYIIERGFKYIDPLLGIEMEVNELMIPFRIPGATRGHITLNKDHIITDIRFYDETCFGTGALPKVYYKGVIKATNEFIGYKVVIEK